MISPRHAHGGHRRRTDGIPPTRVGFAQIIRHREFRVLWLAGAQSQAGDQLARVALSILVFAQTGSGLATAATYALTYLPALLGGIAFAHLADRYPRRALLVAIDVARAVLLLVMAIPGLPLVVLAAVLTVVVAIGAPYKAAEPAVIADLFDAVGSRAQYTVAIGLRTATLQTTQLLGFAAGGLLVAQIGARAALAVDALTFAVSAVLLLVGLRHRPAVAATSPGGLASIRAGIALIGADSYLPRLLGLSWLAGLWIVPEGLAAPYAAEHGGGPAAVGVLLAANPLGMLVGALVLVRWVPIPTQQRLLAPLAVASGVPLAVCAVDPGLAAAAVLWAGCGLLSSYQLVAFAEFVRVVPSTSRGQAIGLANAGLLAAQGVGLLAGGLLAALWGPATAIAACGSVGTVTALLIGTARGRPGLVTVG